jgi:plastocyanin
LKRKYVYFLIAIIAVMTVTYPVVYSVYAGTTSNPNGFSCPPLLPCDNTQPAAETCASFCIVDIQDSTFSPGTINVTVGTTVEWVNHDPYAHTSTALNSSGWSSPIILPGGHFDYTFSSLAPGSYYYECNVHPFMIGQVNVLPANKA